MIPVQMIRLTIPGAPSGEAIQVPIFRLPFFAGQDAFAAPGGFFTTKDGEYGIVVDARLSEDEGTALVTAEIRKNLQKLTALVSDQFEKLRREQSVPKVVTAS